MKYRRFGRTELRMPVISCGGMRYQYKWQDVDPREVPRENQQNIEAIIRRAVELGISPNDKGGKLYSPPKKLVELCAPLTPMQFNDLYCLARKEVHTLSCGAARPGDFDEHVRALDDYEHIAEVIAPIEARLREEMGRSL